MGNQKMFKDTNTQGDIREFLFDNSKKREALNFATIMNALGTTERKLEPMFDDFSKEVDVTKLINEDDNLLNKYSKYFNIDRDKLEKEFSHAYQI